MVQRVLECMGGLVGEGTRLDRQDQRPDQLLTDLGRQQLTDRVQRERAGLDGPASQGADQRRPLARVVLAERVDDNGLVAVVKDLAADPCLGRRALAGSEPTQGKAVRRRQEPV
ncbi:hypothetical protein ACWCQZ_49155 [Streptomyces sp. NPDC002285]